MNRYYWLKLHDDFFDSKRIKKLRRMAGGDTYTIIYLKMQLLAMKRDGVLTFTHLEDNFPEELALDLDESPDDVRVTLAYLLSCGLAETSDEINFFLPYAIENVGSEGSSAQRMREHRARKLSQSDNNVRTLCEHRDVEKEKEIEKDIEIEKREKKREKHRHGPTGHVLLTDEELAKLRERYHDADDRIEALDLYIGSKGDKYKSHYLTILNWDRMHREKESARGSGNVFLDMMREEAGYDNAGRSNRGVDNDQGGIPAGIPGYGKIGR